MNTSSLTLLNLETGEVEDSRKKLYDDQFPIGGRKAMIRGLEDLLDKFTNKECKQIIKIFDAKNKCVGRMNMMIVKFSKATPDMDYSYRSKFKKKLIENQVIGEYNKKIMVNPFILYPIKDANIKNSQRYTQDIWTYMFEDKDKVLDQNQENILEYLFGDTPIREQLRTKVGNKNNSNYNKVVDLQKENQN